MFPSPSLSKVWKIIINFSGVKYSSEFMVEAIHSLYGMLSWFWESIYFRIDFIRSSVIRGSLSCLNFSMAFFNSCLSINPLSSWSISWNLFVKISFYLSEMVLHKIVIASFLRREHSWCYFNLSSVLKLELRDQTKLSASSLFLAWFTIQSCFKMPLQSILALTFFVIIFVIKSLASLEMVLGISNFPIAILSKHSSWVLALNGCLPDKRKQRVTPRDQMSLLVDEFLFNVSGDMYLGVPAI